MKVSINKTQCKHLVHILEQTSVIQAYIKLLERMAGEYDLEPNEMRFLITVIDQYAGDLDTRSALALRRLKDVMIAQRNDV